MLAQVSFVLSQCMRLTDRRTDKKAFAILCIALDWYYGFVVRRREKRL